MCEAKPGPRCASDTCENAKELTAAYAGAFPGGPAVDPISSASATFAPTPAKPSPGKWTADTVEEAFAGLDKRNSSTEKPTVNAKESAAALRHDLRTRYGQPFSVTMSRGTGYGWARVAWADGPRWSEVRALSDKYQDQRFDGMDDSYHPVNQDAPVRYSLSGVNTTREMGTKGKEFVSSYLVRSNVEDFDRPMPSWGGKDLAATFKDDRRLTQDEQHRLINVLGVNSFDPRYFDTPRSAAKFIHDHTDFSGEEPVFDPSKRY